MVAGRNPLRSLRQVVRTHRGTAPQIVAALRARPAPPVDRGPDVDRPATDALHARLTPADLASIEAALEGNLALLWAQAGEGERRYLALLCAAWYRLPDALEHTGLSAAVPPEDVHAMARGPLAAGGDPGLADLVLRALTASRVPLASGARVLDFGCSSGRGVRVLAAARPDVTWLGCDPNPEAIAWAGSHLPGVEWFTSPNAPPLPLDDGTLDVAYAISIWSHFAPGPARAWLDEMHRLIRPGGALVLTVHGLDTIAHHLRGGHASPLEVTEITTSLLRGEVHFDDVFAGRGDWGVHDPGWGNAYLTLDWLAPRVTPAWSITLAESGGLQGVQDVVVLRRES